MTTRIHVDWTRCDGHGSCAELLPELLTTDEWGFPLAHDGAHDGTHDGARDPVVPTALEPYADRARRACPLQALRLVRTD